MRSSTKVILSKYDAAAKLLCILRGVSTVRCWTTGAQTATQTPSSSAAAAGRELKLYQTHAR